MKNVDIQVENGILTMKVDLGLTFGKSSSGKTTIVASSEGTHTLEDGTMIGLNVFRK